MVSGQKSRYEKSRRMRLARGVQPAKTFAMRFPSIVKETMERLLRED